MEEIGIEFFRRRANSCALVYRMSGLAAALRVIREICLELNQVERINAIYVPGDLSRVVNIADTSNEYRAPVTPKADNEELPLVEWKQLDKSIIINNVDPYQIEAWAKDPLRRELPMMRFHSLLRVPVCSTSEYTILFNLWSTHYNHFKENEIAYIEELVAPLGDELGKYFTNDMALLPPSQSPVSGYQRLQLCPGLSHVQRLVEYVANTPTTVLVVGETGVGKESVADAIHELSPRKNKPFIKVNCGAIAETLLDSELFGYEKGAFTGAQSMHQGYFEAANGGTILLDEIGEASLSTQVRLLRVLDTGWVTRVGGNTPIKVDVRVIAATHNNLLDKIDQGTFRKDLWYRLSVFPVIVPPLRERTSDIDVLVHHFIAQKNKKLSREIPERIQSAELKKLLEYSWPGNIRELEHVVERAMIMWELYGKLQFAFEPESSAPVKAQIDISDWPNIKVLEGRYINAVIKKCHGKLTGKDSVSSILGIHYTTLHSRIKKSSHAT